MTPATDILFSGVSRMRRSLASGELSSLELTEACISRAEKYNELGAFLLLAEEQARKSAACADSLISQGKDLPLLGIPVALKDNILTRNICTTAGSRILENFIPPYSATVVQKLEDAGAVIIGKTNLDEFAMGSSSENSAFREVKNPWNAGRVPGGSSGGSAVSVSARLVPLALGTDTGGSVRQPAALCGVVGMKPTYGRVSRHGIVAYASSLDQVGALAACVDDCALLTGVISGHDPMDSTSVAIEVPDFPAARQDQVTGLKIGIPKEYFIGGIEPDVERAVKQAASVLMSLGAELVDISLPHTEAAVATYYIIAMAEASSNLARYDGVRYGRRAEGCRSLDELYCRSRSEGFGPEVKRRILMGTYVLSAGYYDAYYLRSQKVRRLIAADFQNAFEKHCDLVLCPTSPTTAFRIGERTADPLSMYLSDVFTVPVNMAGLPAISIPCGFDAGGLPIGLQLIGKPWDELTLFRAAGAYEQATDWHSRFPLK